jgi:hypothetical protein
MLYKTDTVASPSNNVENSYSCSLIPSFFLYYLCKKKETCSYSLVYCAVCVSFIKQCYCELFTFPTPPSKKRPLVMFKINYSIMTVMPTKGIAHRPQCNPREYMLDSPHVVNWLRHFSEQNRWLMNEKYIQVLTTSTFTHFLQNSSLQLKHFFSVSFTTNAVQNGHCCISFK